ncbi:MAG TPA: efflux RND transporter periplasmic adaptor subunit [Candidatus Tectomicrobia bacterium]
MAFGLLALLGTAGWASRGYFWGSQNGAQYRLTTVERGDISAYVSATGTLNPVIMVQVGTQVSGTIEKLFADYSSSVQEGQIIALLDQASFRAKVAQADAGLENARADLKNAQANVSTVVASIENARAEVANQRANIERVQVEIADAKRDLERHRTLFDRQLISRSELDTAQSNSDTTTAQRNAARAQLDAAEAKLRSAQAQLRSANAQVDKAKAQVSQAQAALEQAQVDLDRTIIRSPITGTVISRNVDIGQTVAASLQAPTLFTIAQDLTKMQVDTNVSEADVGNVAVGQAATFTVDAFPTQVFQGTVREIRQAPIIVQNVVNYNTVIALDNPERKLRPGMTATVSILVARRDQVLKIPKAALRFQPKLSEEERDEIDAYLRHRREGGSRDGAVPVSEAQRKRWLGMPKVWFLTPEGFLRPVQVRLGISDDQFTELIDDGLQEGQALVTGVVDGDGRGGTTSRPSNTSGPPRLRF